MTLSKDAALELLRQQIDESCKVKRSFSTELLNAILSLVQKTAHAYKAGNKVLLMGNGGSAADAQHIAAELVAKLRIRRALGVAGDIVIAISTSGRSRNVVRAVASAREIGCYTAAFTGRTGGDLAGKIDSLLAVPSEETQRIQEAHGLIGHMYCDLLERELFETP